MDARDDSCYIISSLGSRGIALVFSCVKQDDKNMQRFIRLNQQVTIRPPSELNGGRWSAELFSRNKLWQLPWPAVMALVRSVKPISRLKLLAEITRKVPVPRKKVADIVDSLISAGLLEHSRMSGGRIPHVSTDLRRWWDAGALEAGIYHLATFDFPFLDYSEGGDGYRIQRQNMFEYSRVEPDNNRFKEGYKFIRSDRLPPPNQVRIKRSEGLKAVLKILAISLGTTSLKTVPWSSEPLLRRTSPSGGGRHPTEGYLLTSRGAVHHIATRDGALRLIRTGLDVKRLFPKSLNPERHGCPFIIILTCIFERNSFRYREPRTFRTVHMDAGHVAGTIGLLCRAAGLAAHEVTPASEAVVHSALRIDGLSEFHIASIGISEVAPRIAK